MRNQTLMVQSGSYMASSKSLSVDTQWGGAKTFFSKEGLFLIRVQGSGDLFLSSYGAIHIKELGQRREIHSRHRPTWSPSTKPSTTG